MTYVTSKHRQHGAVLIVTLLFLVILTMLGVTAMTGTTFEERMAGNARDSGVAFQAAEAALRDARRDVNNLPVTISATSTDRATSNFESAYGKPTAADLNGNCLTDAANMGRCMPRYYLSNIGSTLPDIPANAVADNFTGAPSVQYGTYTGATAYPIGVLSRQPRYIIELFCLQTQEASIGGQESMCKFYRLTARGFGGNPNTQVTLQEIFLKL
jgi:type IV pilus assembly protein PilX